MPVPDGGTLLEVDGRRRLSLGALAQHDRYLAEVEEDGTIVLTPAVIMPLAEMRLHAALQTSKEVDEFLEHPETGVLREGRRRPRRR